MLTLPSTSSENSRSNSLEASPRIRTAYEDLPKDGLKSRGAGSTAEKFPMSSGGTISPRPSSSASSIYGDGDKEEEVVVLSSALVVTGALEVLSVDDEPTNQVSESLKIEKKGGIVKIEQEMYLTLHVFLRCEGCHTCDVEESQVHSNDGNGRYRGAEDPGGAEGEGIVYARYHFT